MGATRRINDHQPLVTANAMFGMHHKITFFQRTDLAQEIFTTPAL